MRRVIGRTLPARCSPRAATIPPMRSAATLWLLLAGSAGADPREPSRIDSITAEVGLGVGYAFSTCEDQTGCPGDGLAPFTIAGGIGEWFTESSAIELRLANTFEQRPASSFLLAFVGPSIQQWIGPRIWLGVGAGIAIAHGTRTDVVFSFDARAGVLLQKTQQHAVNVSIEAAPAISGGDTSTPVSLLVGYQHL